MRHWNFKGIKRWGRYALAAAFCVGLGALASLRTAMALEETSADVLLKDSMGQIAILRWDYIATPGEWPNGEYYVALLTEKNTTTTGLRYDGSTHLPFRANNWIPRTYGKGNHIPNGDYFYTVGTNGAAMVYYDRDGSSQYDHWDDDNHCPRLALWWCDINGRPQCAIGRDSDWDVCNQWSVENNPEYDDYLKKYIAGVAPTLESQDDHVSWWSVPNPDKNASNRCFCFIHNKSHDRDPAMRIANSGTVYCEKEKDWSDRCYFNIWRGTPTLYSTMKRDYWIQKGQTLNFNAETESVAGMYLSRNTTLVVEKGGTLCLNEKVFNDGTIIVDGGTLVIQEKGRLAPLTRDGKNEIKVINNGVLIIMKGGALYTTNEYPMILSESRLINFGTYAMGGNLYLYSSFVENREGGVIAADMNLAVDARPAFGDGTFTSADACARLGMTQTAESKIYLYDTKAHYSTYGCMDDNGTILNFNQTTDVVWNQKESEELRGMIASSGLNESPKRPAA